MSQKIAISCQRSQWWFQCNWTGWHKIFTQKHAPGTVESRKDVSQFIYTLSNSIGTHQNIQITWIIRHRHWHDIAKNRPYRFIKKNHCYMVGFWCKFARPLEKCIYGGTRKSRVIRKSLIKYVYLGKSFCFKTHDMYIWWNVYMVVPHCTPYTPQRP